MSESIEDLATRLDHSDRCIWLAHETLTDAGYPDFDAATAHIEQALEEGDCRCHCDFFGYVRQTDEEPTEPEQATTTTVDGYALTRTTAAGTTTETFELWSDFAARATSLGVHRVHYGATHGRQVVRGTTYQWAPAKVEVPLAPANDISVILPMAGDPGYR